MIVKLCTYIRGSTPTMCFVLIKVFKALVLRLPLALEGDMPGFQVTTMHAGWVHTALTDPVFPGMTHQLPHKLLFSIVRRVE